MDAATPAHRWTGPLGRAVACLLVAVVAQGFVAGSGSATTEVAGAAAKASCKHPGRAFDPTRAQLPSLGRTVKVVEVQRTSSGAIGAVPATNPNKWVMSMDPKTRPGSRHGTVILAGHTWPDGSALGNAMLANLQPGDQIVLTANGKQACYQITKRASYPVNQVPARKAFRSDGPSRVVIVACSGKRLGPGNWSRRTLWYGSPVQDAPAPPPPPPPPPSNGGLLGGLLGGLFGG